MINNDPAEVRLTDIYSSIELFDKEDLLSLRIQDYGLRILDYLFALHQMVPEQAKEVRMFGKKLTVVGAFKYASKISQDIVASKTNNFDSQRIIVLENGEMVDGHHHLIAAIRINNPLFFIDLAEARA